MSDSPITDSIQSCLDRLHKGDESAREELINIASDWLRRQVHLMLRHFPGVQRWEQTDDVVQNALVRLWNALRDVRPQTAREFAGLATLQIRRELLDLARHYSGAQGLGANYATRPVDKGDGAAPPIDPAGGSSDMPDRLTAWTEFHTQIAALPERERAAFEARWYQNLGNAEAAALLKTSLSTLIRDYQRACRKLHDVFGGELPFA